ncbi:MAG: hypothetical protein KF778_15905 [Rhodocyclaceae bacterium]|nr:hypothetical protein [Rhodocyclaceae bacterium]MBX3669886.1 hypothetical protein [Rhodocyclaceae bacterium]
MRVFLAAAAFWAGLAAAQSIYKVVTPDGKVYYTDRPPAAGAAGVEALPMPRATVVVPGLPAGAAAGSAGPRVGNALPQVPTAPLPTLDALRGSREMDELRACTRANQATLELIRAAEELMRTASNVRNAGAGGATPYHQDLLERQWKHYKSLGGSAATPDAVRPPEDPCYQAKQALQTKSAHVDAQYRACSATRAREMRVFALSREIASGHRYLEMLERVRQEKRDHAAAGSRDDAVYARAFAADPLRVRTELAAKFVEYRNAGGSAARPEEVREIPNPCIEADNRPAPPSPVMQRRSITLPGN